MGKKSRKLILVRNDLLEKVAKITAKEGRTLFSFTNEVFEQAIEAYNMRVTIAEALEFYKMTKIGKNLGWVVIPSNTFDFMAKKLYAIEQEKLLKKCYESGVWNGRYLSVKFHDQNVLEVVQSFMKAILWNLDEFSIDMDKGKIDVKCFSPNLTLECTEMLAKFLEGIFDSLGYIMKTNTCLRGIIMMVLESKKEKEAKPEPLLDVKN